MACLVTSLVGSNAPINLDHVLCVTRGRPDKDFPAGTWRLVFYVAGSNETLRWEHPDERTRSLD